MDSCRSANNASSRANTELHEYAFLDANGEAALLELARLAARMAGMPFAAITLGEPDRLWFKAVTGFDARQLRAGIELCAAAANQREPLLVADTALVPRFATSAGVLTYPHLRAFAGIPLQNGHVHPIGSLFVGDSEPRALSAEQQDVLRVLARQVITQLELARKMAEVRRAEMSCIRAEGQLRDLFESSPDAIFVEDLHGTVLDVNPAACALHQASREWLIGRNVLALVPPALRESVQQDFARLSRLELDYIEGESLTRTGQTVPVEIRASRVEYAGQPALLLHVRDISERKQLQQQFLQAQRTEAIGQLAGGVAHDFNNILTVITGYSELLLLRPELPAAVRRSLKEIEKAGFRGANLTRQLLAFSRKQVLQPRVLDLNSVVTDIEKMLRRLIGEDIELITYPQPNLGHIKADPAQLEQVLMNLAVNARDAMPAGGSLVIGTADVELTEEAARRRGELPAGRYVVLSVTDTGCGMTPEVLGRIFDPFFTTKPAGKGTGLGLATCYGVVKQSGGQILVESTPGHGTKFRIFLPRVMEAATPVAGAALPENAELHGSETILLVEDEVTVRQLAAETLRGFGYTVLEAGNGEEALVLARQKIDLLLTDVVMPQISGRELAGVIQQSDAGTRVLFTSGYTNDNLVIQEILRDGVGFLEKPYTGTALARKIREVLSNSGET